MGVTKWLPNLGGTDPEQSPSHRTHTDSSFTHIKQTRFMKEAEEERVPLEEKRASELRGCLDKGLSSDLWEANGSSVAQQLHSGGQQGTREQTSGYSRIRVVCLT
jgi:hypothetical protein